MNNFVFSRIRARLLIAALMLGGACAPLPCRGGGVTFITHGLNGDTDGWVTGMANRITNYSRFPGANATIYKAYFYSSNSTYYLTAARVAGSPPTASDCGEIIVKFDWSQLADGNSYNTYQVAAAAVPALLSTNFIPELGGHALAELPLHLAGHSRGGSLISEMSRLLGTNGVWVDHLTTLDPHPLNNDGFTIDSFLYSAVDAPARTYANVLFHDNYWQSSGFIHGEQIGGAYVRQPAVSTGGYGGLAGPHSNVHLWYHGTLDSRTPASDTEASVTATERTNWWVAYEAKGTNAGFEYSLIGGGDRLSAAQPLGPGFPVIHDGYNQTWDFGAGNAGNRTALTTNYGNWPSVIKMNRTQTNRVVQGQSTPISFFYQWARPTNNLATIAIYLDDDLNPWNNNQKLLAQITAPATGAPAYIGSGNYNVPLLASNAAPGWHALFAVISSSSGRLRYLYAPELVQVVSNLKPTLDITRTGSFQFQIGVNGSAGQTIILQTGSNLVSWQSVATNTLSTGRWIYTNNPAAGTANQFYRATLEP